MVIIIPEQDRVAMSRKAIKEAYDGKWIFLIQIKNSPEYSAIPVVIADKPYEDREQGIYNQFQSAECGLTGHISLLTTSGMLGFEVF